MNKALKGQRSSDRQGGFTLIEIMVVVMLIALTIGFVSINLGRDLNRLTDLEARRFQKLVDYVREESVVTGRLLGIVVDDSKNSYRFLHYQDGWQETEDDDTLRERVMEEGVKLRFTLEDEAGKKGKKIEGAPFGLVMVEPMGSITPFKLRVEGGEAVFEVYVDEDEQIEIRTPGAGR